MVIVDRYTNWASVYKVNRAEGIIQALRYHFVSYGAPEEITTDGGPEYVATETQNFLRRWNVAHRLASAYHPSSNLRAELGVKIIKRLLMENTGINGSLNSDKVGRALLAYRNTPNKDTGLSPAQMLFGRNLKDHMPMAGEKLQLRREWLMIKEDRETALAAKYGKIEEDRTRNSREQKELEPGTIVQIQNQHGKEPLRWDKSGTVVENRGNQQYSIKMDGSGRMTLRNRRFLRVIKPIFRRHISYDDARIDEEGKAVAVESGKSELRKEKIRRRKAVDRYQAEW